MTAETAFSKNSKLLNSRSVGFLFGGDRRRVGGVGGKEKGDQGDEDDTAGRAFILFCLIYALFFSDFFLFLLVLVSCSTSIRVGLKVSFILEK